MNRLALALVGSLVAVLTIGGVVVAPPVAPAANAAELIGPYPHPKLPNIDVYMDSKGVFFARNNAAGEFDVLPRNAAAALNKAQSVPTSFYQRMTAAAKAGTGGALSSVSKVLTVAGSSTYSPAAVLAKTGKLASAPPKVAAAAVKSAPRVLATAVNGVTKVLGPVSFGVVGYQLGMMTGNGAVDLLGIDGDGLVCKEDAAGFLSFATGRDCAAWEATQEAIAQANADITAGVFGEKVCKSGSTPNCFQLLGFGVTQYSNRSASIVAYCGPRWGSDHLVRFTLADGTVNSFKQPGSATGCSGLPEAPPGATNLQYQYDVPYQDAAAIAAKQKVVGYCVVNYTTNANLFLSQPCGSPVSPVEIVEKDALRTLECTIVGTDGNSYTESSETYRESSGKPAVPQCPVLPEGVYPANVTLDQTGGRATNTLYDEPTSPEYQQLAAAYPECMDGSCMLDLRVNGASCFEGQTDCAEWVTDPEKESKYSCKYGTHDMPLNECLIYGQIFKQGAATGAAPWADPETGAFVGGAQAAPAGADAMQAGAASADEPRECWPSGWAVFNPVEWVLRPVQCALEWAFVPRQSVLVDVQLSAVSSWERTTPAKVLLAIGDIGPALLGLNDPGCAGLLVDLSGVAPDILHLTPQRFLPACPGDFFHPWAVAIKAFLVISLTIGAGFGFKAQISRFVSNGEA